MVEAVELVVEVDVVAVAEVVSSPGHQHPNNVDGMIGFGSRNRASVRQGKAGGKTREESIGRRSHHLGLAAIVDHATAGLLKSQRLLDQAEWVITLGKDLIVFKHKPVAAGVRSCTLAAVGAKEWMGPESLPTPSAASFRRSTGCHPGLGHLQTSLHSVVHLASPRSLMLGQHNTLKTGTT
ncbi:hypothetical protein H6G65_14540 [Microcystis elabens FACHB-917]|nr:hypothetical protein [Microcystis elabens FACHB-917]